MYAAPRTDLQKLVTTQLQSATCPSTSSPDAPLSSARFVVETWQDQREVRRIIAKELERERASALGFEQRLRRLLQRPAEDSRVNYAAVHRRYETMKARGEIAETEAFAQLRARSPFARPAGQP